MKKYMSQETLITISFNMKIVEAIFTLPFLYQAKWNGDGLIIGIPLLFVGQYLYNLTAAILGDGGIYYGIEMKTVKPRIIVDFPFNIADPMYKGDIITIIGIMFCFNSTKELMIIGITWIFSIFYSIIVENT